MSFPQLEGMFIVYHFQLFTLLCARIVKEQKFSTNYIRNNLRTKGTISPSIVFRSVIYLLDRSCRRMLEVEVGGGRETSRVSADIGYTEFFPSDLAGETTSIVPVVPRPEHCYANCVFLINLNDVTTTFSSHSRQYQIIRQFCQTDFFQWVVGGVVGVLTDHIGPVWIMY